HPARSPMLSSSRGARLDGITGAQSLATETITEPGRKSYFVFAQRSARRVEARLLEVREWRPHRDSNSGYRRERAASWATRRWGCLVRRARLAHQRPVCTGPSWTTSNALAGTVLSCSRSCTGQRESSVPDTAQYWLVPLSVT